MTVVRLPTGYWHEYASQLKGCLSGANMTWWAEYLFGWERGCMTWIRLQWWGRNWIMWANGCIKQTNIWLNWKINTGQSASKDPAILPLPASAIQHVWKKQEDLYYHEPRLSERRETVTVLVKREIWQFYNGGTVKQWFRWKWKAAEKQLLMQSWWSNVSTDTLLESRAGFHSSKSNKNSEPAMVYCRDAENEVLSSQDDCMEKMRYYFASSKVIKLVINDVIKWWRM